MNRKSRTPELGFLLISMLLALMPNGCNGRVDAAAEAPPPANIAPDVDLTLRFGGPHEVILPVIKGHSRVLVHIEYFRK